MGKAVKGRACPNAQCAMWGEVGKGNIRLHGFLKLKRGRRRRYWCETCDRTFVSSVGTPPRWRRATLQMPRADTTISSGHTVA